MDDDSTAVLLRMLTGIASEISEIPDSKSVVRKDCCNLTRRLRLLVPLFEELGEIEDRFPESSVAALVLLKEALENARELLRFCSKSSKIYLVLEREQIKLKFHELNFRFEQALGGLSYDKLEISDEVKEQVELVQTQFRRANERIDAPVLDLCKDLFSICNLGNDVDAEPAASTLSDILKLIGVEDVKQESLALHEIVIGNGGDPGDSIQKMSILLKKLEEFVQPENEEKSTLANKNCSLPGCSGQANTDQSQSPAIPDDFRCPISLELMKEPVIISTGQTYERACIKKWLDAGHGTCPKTQQILSGTTLTPNYVLCSLISNWCLANGLEPPKRSGHYLQSKATSASCGEGVELDTLMSKLTSNNIEDQRSAAGELRRLAKYNGDNRVFIAEAGAIPLLVGLLYTTDTRTQEHAVTALLNLSICEDNKGIITSEALPGILHVLKNGSMEARENAAATLFSLSAVDEYKVTIGASGAIPALVALLSDGSQRGKVDAATALFNLCIYQGNKGRAVRAGVVPMLMTLMTQPGSEMVDEALAVMAILSSHPDGRAAIGALEAVPTLVELIGNGSPRNKENATAVLVQLCMGEPSHLSKAQSLGVAGPLLDLAENGTERGKRKAAQLFVLIHSSAECRDQAQVQADNAQPPDQVIVE